MNTILLHEWTLWQRAKARIRIHEGYRREKCPKGSEVMVNQGAAIQLLTLIEQNIPVSGGWAVIKILHTWRRTPRDMDRNHQGTSVNGVYLIGFYFAGGR